MPRVAFYRHERDDQPIVGDPSWEELVGILGADGAWEGPCTLANCAGHKCPHKMRSPRGVSAWSPVRIVPGGTRSNRCVESVTELVLDLDAANPAIIAEVARRLEGWRYIAHSTHADRFSIGGAASFRVVVALEAEVPAASWRDYRLAAIAHLGLDDPRFRIDPTCKDASRLYFLPSHPIGYAPVYERSEGAVLPLSLVPPVRAVVLPALAPPVPPVAIVPLPAAADLGELRRALAEHRHSLAHRADLEARERADLLGRVLEGKPIAEPGARGSTIYRLASICAFCWPVGTPVEAFVEMIRASMSATSTAPTPGSNSLEAVDHWPHAVDCFRRASAQRAQKAVAEEAERGALAARLVAAQSGPSGAAAPSEEWQSELVLNRDRTLRAVGLNALILLRNDPEVEGTVRWNAVTCSVEVSGGPLAGRHDLDDTITAAQDWLQSRHQLNLRREDVGRRLVMIAHEYPFDPLREYLLSLKWDGIRRLDNWLVAYAGARPTGDGYVGFVGRKWMVSGVARALSPGCKADVVLVAEGGQGQAKSTALRILGGEFYAEAAGVLGDKDSMMLIGQKWIVELPDMASFSRTDRNRMKAFFTMQVDRYRAPYARGVTAAPRRCVFAATTNDEEYLGDPTGHRRFWPIALGEIDRAALIRDRYQLWAEAVAIYLGAARCAACAAEQVVVPDQEPRCPTHSWWLTPAERAVAAAHAKLREEVDSWTDSVLAWVSETAARNQALDLGRQKPITTANVLMGALLFPLKDVMRSHEMRVSAILRLAGWTRERRGRDAPWLSPVPGADAPAVGFPPASATPPQPAPALAHPLPQRHPPQPAPAPAYPLPYPPQPAPAPAYPLPQPYPPQPAPPEPSVPPRREQ